MQLIDGAEKISSEPTSEKSPSSRDEWASGQVPLFKHLKRFETASLTDALLIELIPRLRSTPVRRRGIGISLNDPDIGEEGKGGRRRSVQQDEEDDEKQKSILLLSFVRLFYRSVQVISTGNQLLPTDAEPNSPFMTEGLLALFSSRNQQHSFFRIIMQA